MITGVLCVLPEQARGTRLVGPGPSLRRCRSRNSDSDATMRAGVRGADLGVQRQSHGADRDPMSRSSLSLLFLSRLWTDKSLDRADLLDSEGGVQEGCGWIWGAAESCLQAGRLRHWPRNRGSPTLNQRGRLCPASPFQPPRGLELCLRHNDHQADVSRAPVLRTESVEFPPKQRDPTCHQPARPHCTSVLRFWNAFKRCRPPDLR